MVNKHILIADDDRNFVELLSLHLQAHNYVIATAYRGDQVLKKAKEKPDLILLDIMLPDMSGYEICRRLREEKATSRIPIIMLTAKDAPEEKIEGLYIGADDYLIKPFDSEELFARIEAILRRTQTFEERVKDKAKAINELKQIIQQGLIVPLFQPIFYLQPRKLLGMELLSRPPAKGYFANPEVLFDTAFHLGMYFDLEKISQQKALDELGEKSKEMLIFFNVSPYLVQDKRFKDFTSFYQQYTKPEKIVLELTERTAIKDFPAFFRRLKFFKEKGYKVSIDDIGSGYASLNSIVEIKPNFIKIDIHLIHNIERDAVRQNLLKAVVEFCKQSKIIPIAEGVERQEELDILLEFGVDAAQGYLLGRPSAEVNKGVKSCG